MGDNIRFMRFDDPTEPIEQPRYPFVTTVQDRTPPGAVRVEGEVYLYNGEMVVLGKPASEGDWPDYETAHNCDEMGCTSVSHVVLRAKVTSGLAAPADVERPQRITRGCGCVFELLENCDGGLDIHRAACPAHPTAPWVWPRIAGAYLVEQSPKGEG